MLYALRYAASGMRVHPLYEVDPETQTCACYRGKDCTEKQRGKHPRLGGWQDKATTDEEQIRKWWRPNLRAGVGIATGAASKVWVLDVDGPEAMAWYDAQAKTHGLVHTLGVKTARGAHLYWRYPEGVTIRNAQGLRAAGAPNVDVRGEGGYVCAPPTVHRSGHVYEWVREDGFAQEPQLAPEWLLELVKERPKPVAPKIEPPKRAMTMREVTALFRHAADTDPNVREKIGHKVRGSFRAASRPYFDDITCPRCGRPEVWFYLDGGPAVCHHQNSCDWAGPITSL